jgi:LPXTG-motif cell wall-anchored protein
MGMYVLSPLRIVLTLCIAILISIPPIYSQSSSGKDFWFGFMSNVTDRDRSLYTAVSISADTNSKVIVEVPSENWKQEVFLTRDSSVIVIIPKTHTLFHKANTISKKAVHIKSTNKVSIVALNYLSQTADAALIYPVQSLGTDHILFGYENTSRLNEALFVAIKDSTTIAIDKRYTTSKEKNDTITLMKGETYLFSRPWDISGVIISSNNAISVFSGVDCADVPHRPNRRVCCCDHLYEQIPPTTAWGKTFITVPYKTRKADLFRFIAGKDTCKVTLNGKFAFSIPPGKTKDTLLSFATKVTSNNRLLLAQMSMGQQFDNVNSDPFYILVSPVEQSINYVTFDAFTARVIKKYYVNVVLRKKDLNTFYLDGDSTHRNSFVPLEGDSTFVIAQLDIARGRHNMKCGGEGFNAYVYGYGLWESFGYNAGTKLEVLVEPQKAGSNTWIFIVLGALALGGGGYYLYSKKRNQQNT